ncbi:MAG: putative OB-fold protein [Halioglobus sp.]|jgi:uncharacterized OB-fold protein
MSDIDNGPKAATPYLKFSDTGEPFLQGVKCSQCSQTYLGARDHCAKCTARDCMLPIDLGTSGRLYNYTIVYRSYPGITVPFVSAVVDLDSGCTIKGNLLDVEPSPENLDFDMPVEIVFRGAELSNPAGEGFISHFFVPAKGARS